MNMKKAKTVSDIICGILEGNKSIGLVIYKECDDEDIENYIQRLQVFFALQGIWMEAVRSFR